MNDPSLDSKLQIDRQFYAVAFSEGLCAVEYDHPPSAALGPLGVKVHSLSPRLEGRCVRAIDRPCCHDDGLGGSRRPARRRTAPRRPR